MMNMLVGGVVAKSFKIRNNDLNMDMFMPIALKFKIHCLQVLLGLC